MLQAMLKVGDRALAADDQEARHANKIVMPENDRLVRMWTAFWLLYPLFVAAIAAIIYAALKVHRRKTHRWQKLSAWSQELASQCRSLHDKHNAAFWA